MGRNQIGTGTAPSLLRSPSLSSSPLRVDSRTQLPPRSFLLSGGAAGRRGDGSGGWPSLYILLVGLVLAFAYMAFGYMPVWSSPWTLPSGVWGLAVRRPPAVAAWCRGKLERAEPVSSFNKLAGCRAPRQTSPDLRGGEGGGVEEEFLAASSFPSAVLLVLRLAGGVDDGRPTEVVRGDSPTVSTAATSPRPPYLRGVSLMRLILLRRFKAWHGSNGGRRFGVCSSSSVMHQGVPKFGSWEDEGHGYTQYFENARKGKSPGRSVNPNDRNEATEAPTNDPPSVKASPLRAGSEPGLRKNRDERRTTREDDLCRQSPNHRYGDQTSNDGAARKASTEKSPMHPRHAARLANKGGAASPSGDRRGSSEGNRGNAPTTPGRSRMRSTGRGDETPETGSAVPKFGDWDEKDPSTGEGFTDIFEKVREEKQSGSDNVSTSHAYTDRYNRGGRYESSGCSCFSWLRK